MSAEWLTPELEEKIRLLKEKYAATGQDLNAYLEGLIYSDYLKYWDYVNLDALRRGVGHAAGQPPPPSGFFRCRAAGRDRS